MPDIELKDVVKAVDDINTAFEAIRPRTKSGWRRSKRRARAIRS